MSPPEREDRSLEVARLQAWCLICFLWGTLWLNYPFLEIFNSAIPILGLPLLVIYCFGLWVLLILILYFLMRCLRRYF